MPIGITRLNARHQQPNTRITFIKPLEGPTSTYALDFLERIAAICHPIMKANHLSLMTLEEYAPNSEFVGRNFNAGEIVQLVLRARDGSWLSFRSVQMVMMHELAHCMQMNHSAAFWKVRNAYAEELRGLWGKGYTGDGFWGRGKTVLSREYENEGPVAEGWMPRSLCGGTYRSRGRKRKRKGGGAEEKLSYAEQKQKRIAKRFGTNGMALGGDEDTRVKLEDGQKVRAKPRVAGSSRGRELRAAAALARFGQQKEEESAKAEEKRGSGSDTDDEEYEDMADGGREAVDVDGSRILDGKGHVMVKICEDEDQDDVYVKQEMQELQDLDHVDSDTQRASREGNDASHDSSDTTEGTSAEAKGKTVGRSLVPTTSKTTPAPALATNPDDEAAEPNDPNIQTMSCPICSMANGTPAITCVVCSHVLDRNKVPGFWNCRSSICADSQYTNVADCALCGVCGARRPE